MALKKRPGKPVAAVHKGPVYDEYRLLVQEVKDYAIFMLDPTGHIRTWNAGAQRLKGYTEQEAIGKHFSIFYDKEDLARHKPERELETAITEGRVEDEGWRLRKDGTRFWADVIITAIHDDKGKLRGFAKITRDLTERRKNEETLRNEAALLERRVNERTAELDKANRMKDEFIATLSHELRTPITSIAGWVQMLESGELSQAQQGKAIGIIDKNLTGLAQLIDDLLNVSRIVAGKMQLDMQLVYPAPLVEDAINSILPTAIARKLNITHDLDAELGPMRLDPTRFHQIIWNLLSNAVKFTPAKGRVHISLKRINSHALLQVSDSGEGIDPDFLPYIFDRFRQADPSRSRKHTGLGVGLTIAKYLVELHGGTISVQSEGPGKGSTFDIHLPIPALSWGVPAKRNTQGKLPLKGARILLVEDEKDTREMIAQALKLRGAKAIQASSAKEAFILLREQLFDVIVSDIGMPEMDGYAFIREVRSMSGPVRKIPAIALTAYAGADDQNRSIEAGFTSHISKPITLTELVRVISKLIGSKAA